MDMYGLLLNELSTSLIDTPRIWFICTRISLHSKWSRIYGFSLRGRTCFISWPSTVDNETISSRNENYCQKLKAICSA